MKRRRTAEAWDDFARKVLPLACSPVQRQEMRRAFYAGADAVLLAVMHALGPDTGEPSAEDLQVMTDLQEEFADFARSVKEGRA